MSLPVLTICAALGQQGAGVGSAFMSQETTQYHIRALTSNTESPAAKRLATKPNISVVGVDLNSIDTIISAFEGSSLIFANTAFQPAVFARSGAAACQELEARQGLNIAQAASQTPSLKHLIWSTLPDALKESAGKHDIPHFQSKIPAEQYIMNPKNGLSNKTTFLRVGLYGSVIEKPPYTPFYSDGANIRLLVLPISADSLIPFAGDAPFNVGQFVKAIFAQPEKTIGRYVNATAELTSIQEYAKTLETALKSQGKEIKVNFLECSLSDFEQLWGALGTEIGLMFKYFNDHGDGNYETDPHTYQYMTAKDLGIEGVLRKNEDTLAQIEW
ncbi:HSCARG dehydrogenase [Diaporthe amygdali]|uniref:HSCARG dehydrogenase n=1 Tax=Phomopsis amygdali TaxID=1214568 RepID=UPI0022FDD69B|nr:HSCARG dehydrogenase [Diaporthe amygdali]KAJ0119898.1 HSCARG dehydrogenase [Diaporthe amygdali]